MIGVQGGGGYMRGAGDAEGISENCNWSKGGLGLGRIVHYLIENSYILSFLVLYVSHF